MVWHRLAMASEAIGEGSDGEVAGVAAVAGVEAGEEELDTMEVTAIPFNPLEPDADNRTVVANGEAEIEAEGDTPSMSSEPEGIDKSEAPYKIGDVVLGRMLWCNERGAKIELLDYPGHQGFVARRDYPYRILEAGSEPMYQPKSLLIGYVREYLIMNIPDQIILGRMGPLLSARELDKKLMMDRMVQIYDVCRQDREVLTARVFAVNKGGLKALIAGRTCFIPKSHIVDDEIKNLTQEEFLEKYMDKEFETAVIQVDTIDDRVLLSMKRAEQYANLKSLRPGSLVWGTVRKVMEWGAFIGIDGTHDSALIHRSNISKGRFSSVEDIFQIGDRVCAVVLGMEDDFSRLSCSTADLEQQPGDMVKDRQYVYEHAEEQMEHIRSILAEREEEIFDDIDDFEAFEN